MRPGILRRGVLNSLVFLGAVVLALLLAEGSLRVLNVVPAGGVQTVTSEEFAAVPGIFAPGQRMVVQQVTGLPHVVTINTLGYRGADFPLRKPAGEARVVLVGDSFTFGEHVNDDDTLPRRLETELGTLCAGVRVINAGVGGTTISDHRHVAERSLALDPDLMVLVFYENDVINLAGPRMWDELAANRARKSRFPFSVIYRYTRSSALWNLLMRVRGQWRTAGERQDLARNPAEKRERDRSALRTQYADRLRDLVKSMAAHGRPLAATAFPSHHTLRGSSWERIEWFSTIVAESRIPYFDIAQELARTKRSTSDSVLVAAGRTCVTRGVWHRRPRTGSEHPQRRHARALVLDPSGRNRAGDTIACVHGQSGWRARLHRDARDPESGTRHMANKAPTKLTAAAGRSFGLTVGAAFLVIAGILWWRDHSVAATITGSLGALLALAGLVIPTHLGPVERAWMALAHAISKVTTPIVMGVMYLLVITPVGLLRRTLGGNPMVHRREHDSYWRPRPPGARRTGSLSRQF